MGVMTVRLSHHLIDDEFRFSPDVKPLNLKFGGDAPLTRALYSATLLVA
jgi:hypothetical protein